MMGKKKIGSINQTITNKITLWLKAITLTDKLL